MPVLESELRLASNPEEEGMDSSFEHDVTSASGAGSVDSTSESGMGFGAGFDVLFFSFSGLTLGLVIHFVA